jgi:hypothetical protein
MNRQDIINWINDLKKQESQHYSELDSKDCGELGELLYSLMTEIEHLTISEFNQERINRWIELTKLMDAADGHTRCPLCKEQMIGCDCVRNLAQDILESKFIRSIRKSNG